MLTYTHDPKRQAFHDAIEQARKEGLDFDDLTTMLTAAERDTHATNGAHPAEPEDVMYEPGQLPDGLIDLPSASKKYGIKPATLRMWIQRGRLPRRGRLRGPSPGRGYIVTEEAEIERCRDNPRKPWHNKSVMS